MNPHTTEIAQALFAVYRKATPAERRYLRRFLQVLEGIGPFDDSVVPPSAEEMWAEMESLRDSNPDAVNALKKIIKELANRYRRKLTTNHQ